MRLFISVVLLALSCSLAQGQQLDLFEAEVLVTDQSEGERRRATLDGLADVLVRVSGQNQVLENPQIEEALDEAASYLVEWRYENSDRTLTANGREQPALRLVLRYSPTAVNDLLQDLRLPVWPANRPNTLVWLMVDSYQGRQRVSDDDAEEVLQAVERSAKRRGLPLITPLMDLEDQVALPDEALWNLDQERIRTASERYDPDSILVGRLTEVSGGRWRASWDLLHRDRAPSFDSRGGDLRESVAAGIDQVADHFFELYAILPSEGPDETVAFQVDAVDNFADYSRLMDYLGNLAVVGGTDLVAVRDDSVLVYVALAGQLDSLRDALALDERMLPLRDVAVGDNAAAGTPSNPLRYRWR